MNTKITPNTVKKSRYNLRAHSVRCGMNKNTPATTIKINKFMVITEPSVKWESKLFTKHMWFHRQCRLIAHYTCVLVHSSSSSSLKCVAFFRFRLFPHNFLLLLIPDESDFNTSLNRLPVLKMHLPSKLYSMLFVAIELADSSWLFSIAWRERRKQRTKTAEEEIPIES